MYGDLFCDLHWLHKEEVEEGSNKLVGLLPLTNSMARERCGAELLTLTMEVLLPMT